MNRNQSFAQNENATDGQLGTRQSRYNNVQQWRANISAAEEGGGTRNGPHTRRRAETNVVPMRDGAYCASSRAACLLLDLLAIITGYYSLRPVHPRERTNERRIRCPVREPRFAFVRSVTPQITAHPRETRSRRAFTGRSLPVGNIGRINAPPRAS